MRMMRRCTSCWNWWGQLRFTDEAAGFESCLFDSPTCQCWRMQLLQAGSKRIMFDVELNHPPFSVTMLFLELIHLFLAWHASRDCRNALTTPHLMLILGHEDEHSCMHGTPACMHGQAQTRAAPPSPWLQCEGGELFDRVARQGVLTERVAAHFFRQIVSVVAHMHSLHIAHRDLKPVGPWGPV